MSKQKKLKVGTAKERADHRANVAIKKDVAGTPYFFGRERNKRSRKYRQKLLTKLPVNLTRLPDKVTSETKQQ